MSQVSFLKKLSIKQKMLTGFGVMLVILTIGAVQTLVSISSIKNSVSDVVQEHQTTILTSYELGAAVKNSLSGMGFYLLSKEPIYKDRFKDELVRAQKLLNELKKLKSIKHNASNASLVTKIEQELHNFAQYQDKLLQLAINNELNFPGMSYSAEKINPISQTILQNIALMRSSEEEEKKRLELLNLIHEMRFTWSRLMNGIRGYLGFRNAFALDEINNYNSLFKKQVQDIQNQYGESLSLEQEEALSEINKAYSLFPERLEAMLKTHGSDRWRQDAYLIRSEIGPVLERLQNHLNTLISTQRTVIQQRSSELVENSQTTSMIIITLLIIAIVGTITLAYLLMTGIIKPMTDAVDNGMRALKRVMQNLSGDKSNLNLNTEFSSNDAVDNVASTFDMLTSALQTTILREQEATEDLKGKVNMILDVVRRAEDGDLTGQMMVFSGGEAIDELANGTQRMVDNLNELVSKVQQSGIQVNSTATEIAATAKQQEATVTEQAASTNEIMATVTEISATSKELVHTMEEISTVAEGTAESAAEGQEALNRMADTMRKMRSATESITAKLAVLSEKAGNINTVVTTINKVADQTNLLSLNAAIEAEKAGEYGRGFAVVATEIRRLADQTAVATWDIEQMVKEMQSAVSAGVMGMDKFSEEVDRGAEDVTEIGNQLGTIIDQVQTLTPRFESVTEGMQSQSLGGEQISESMIQLNETAQQTAESLRQSNMSIQQLKEAANTLQKAVSIFKVRR